MSSFNFDDGYGDGGVVSGMDDSPEPKKPDPAIARASELGFNVVMRASHQLLVDLDNGAELNLRVLEFLTKDYGKPKYEEWPSKSGRGKHVVLSFGVGIFQKAVSFTDHEALLLECALGGDPMRQVMALRRVQKEIPHPSVLFQPTENIAPELRAAFATMTQEEVRQVFTAGAVLLEKK